MDNNICFDFISVYELKNINYIKYFPSGICLHVLIPKIAGKNITIKMFTNI